MVNELHLNCATLQSASHYIRSHTHTLVEMSYIVATGALGRGCRTHRTLRPPPLGKAVEMSCANARWPRLREVDV